MACDHKKGRWETYTVQDWDEGEVTKEEWVVRSTMEDIDTHRMKCSQCGEIGYYSSAARSFYENGKRTPGVAGLE